MLGKYLVRKSDRRVLIGKIVEVEAYLGKRDPASHAFRGKTRRNEVMFYEGGHLYVYFTYGMHYCANVVTGPEGIGEAVLLRAVEPIQGVEIMRRRRKFGKANKIEYNLTNGPAKLCQAFAISGSENGTDLLKRSFTIVTSRQSPKPRITASTRVGIRVATERPWRFFITGNAWVSTQRAIGKTPRRR